MLPPIEPFGLFFLCILFYHAHGAAADLIWITLSSQLTLKKNSINRQIYQYSPKHYKGKSLCFPALAFTEARDTSTNKGHAPVTHIQPWETCHSISAVLLRHRTRHLHRLLSLTPGNLCPGCNPYVASTGTSRTKFRPV